MNIIKIKAPESAVTLSDFMTEFPNGILNKKETGVGATYLAINNHENYIIAVPTKELVQNKTYQHSHLFGMTGDTKKEELITYINNSKTLKIMVVYNSLPRLVSILNQHFNTIEHFKLLVDEYHTLLSDYSYRNEAIDNLILEAMKFKHKCFVSATPINANYCPKELATLDNYEIEWKNTTKLIPFRHKTTKPFQAAVNIIKRYKAGNYSLKKMIKGKEYESNEAYFFVNSVKAIKEMIVKADLKESEVKIICSDNERNRAVLKDLEISKVSDPNKPFTFITSKAFLGSDFYSENGIVFIISSVQSKHTLYDMATDIFQIAGRIRTTSNPFKNFLYHIYNTGASDMTLQEFEELVKEKEQNTRLQLSAYNKFLPAEKKAFKTRMEMDMEEDYISLNPYTQELEFNELKKLSERFKFEIVYETYTNGLSIRDSYLKAGFDVTEAQIYTKDIETFISSTTSNQFKKCLKEYIDILDCRIQPDCVSNEERLKELESLHPCIKEYTSSLSTSQIRTLKFNQQLIKETIYSNSEKKNVIKEAIKHKYEFNKPYPVKDVKNYLKEIYKRNKFLGVPRIKELESYFKIQIKVGKKGLVSVKQITFYPSTFFS